jgi:hypothetical protein
MKWPAHRVTLPVTYRSNRKDFARLREKEDRAFLRAILEFTQEEQPDIKYLRVLSGWLPDDRERLNEVREKLKGGLRQLFIEPTEIDEIPAWDIRAERGLAVRLEKSGAVSYSADSFDEQLFFRTVQALSNLLGKSPRLIRKCEREGCERLFIPHKRQTYCSPQCSQRARFEKFRGSFTDEQWREKRRNEHVKKIAETKGIGAARHVRRRAPRKAAGEALVTNQTQQPNTNRRG